MAPSILVVDDEADLVATYRRVLLRHRHQVLSAETRRTALETLSTERVDLVVADLRLPDGDGLDVVRAAQGARVPPPVIVVTGYASGVGRGQALDAGASEYIAKPFAISEFLALVEAVLEQAARRS